MSVLKDNMWAIELLNVARPWGFCGQVIYY